MRIFWYVILLVCSSALWADEVDRKEVDFLLKKQECTALVALDDLTASDVEVFVVACMIDLMDLNLANLNVDSPKE